MVNRKRLKDHIHRAVRQCPFIESKELIQSTGIDNLSTVRFVAHRNRRVVELHNVTHVDIQIHIDQVVVEQVLEEPGVALFRHTLMRRLRKIAVVVADKDWNTAHHSRVDLIRGLAPLLHRVVEEDVLVDVVCDFLELRIVLLTQIHDGNLFVLPEGRDEFLVEVLTLLLSEGQLQ